MKIETFEKLKSPHFLRNLIERTENSITKSFWRLCEKKLSLREYINSTNDKKSTLIRNNKVSVIIGNEIEEELCPLLKSMNIVSEHVDNEIGDFLIENTMWELKTSKEKTNGKGIKTLQGSTHSGSKCDNYIFIRYGINIDKILKWKDKPNNIIDRLHFSVHRNVVKKEYWIGKHTNKNSRTTLKVPIGVYEDFSKGLVFGEIKPGRKFLQFLTLPLYNLMEY